MLFRSVSAIKGEIGKYTEAIRESNRELESAKSSWGEVYAQLEDIRRQAQAGDGGTLKDRAGEFLGRVREASSNLLQPARQLFEKLFRDGFGGFAKAGRDAAPADQGAPGGPKTGSAEKKKKNGFAPAAKQVLSLAKRLKVVLTLSKAIGGAFKRLGGTIKEALVSPAVHKGLRNVSTGLYRKPTGANLDGCCGLSSKSRWKRWGALLRSWICRNWPER